MTRAQQLEEKDAAAALPGTSMDDEAARTGSVDGGTVYRYQQEIAQMVCV